MPDDRRERSSDHVGVPLDVVHGDPALRVAHPHAGGELGDVAAEPGIGEVLGGPGLASGGPAREARGHARPMRHDALEGQRDQVRVVLPEHLFALDLRLEQ